MIHCCRGILTVWLLYSDLPSASGHPCRRREGTIGSRFARNGFCTTVTYHPHPIVSLLYTCTLSYSLMYSTEFVSCYTIMIGLSVSTRFAFYMAEMERIQVGSSKSISLILIIAFLGHEERSLEDRPRRGTIAPKVLALAIATLDR